MRIVSIIAIIIAMSLGNAIAQEVKEYKVTDFSKVKFEGSAQWVLIPSKENKVVVESTSEDVFDYVEVRQDGDKLVVNTTDKNKNITKLFKSAVINVYFNSISHVYLSGVGSVKSKGEIHSDALKAVMKGTGDMTLEVRCADFQGSVQGTGGMTVEGKTDKGIVRVEGVGGFDGYNLICSDMDVTVSGVGGAKVHAIDKITATLNGVGSIKFKGNPETKNLNTNGVGNIKHVND